MLIIYYGCTTFFSVNLVNAGFAKLAWIKLRKNLGAVKWEYGIESM